MKLRHLDLFSGIGGFSLGLEATGAFETIAFCDIEKYCLEVLEKRFPRVPRYTDLRELNYERLRADGIVSDTKKIDIITGGYPCQLGLLEKTLVDTLNSVLTPLSKTWKMKVTPLGRLVFQLRASAPTTKEKESGLWLTPSTTVISNRSPEAMEKRKQFRKSIGRNTVNPGNLAEQIQYGNKTTDMKMWRTPDNIAGGSNLPGIKKALDEGHLKRPSGQPMQIRLQDQVREERLHPQPQKWPTPTANEDAAGRPTGKMQKMLGNHPDVRGMGGGTLNPTWVEWLMGYPKGWTDLNLSVTPWFPPSPTTSDSASSSPTWPTPMARSHSTPRLPETMAKTGRNPLTNTLEDAVQYREIEKRKKWPTPRSRDWKDGYGVPPSVERGTRGHTLGTKVQEEEKKKIKMWPTPTANDGKRGEINKDGTVKETWKKRKDRWAAKGVNMHRPLDIAVALDEEENK